jgi:hypothetical protein
MDTAFEGAREPGKGAFGGGARPPAAGKTSGATGAWTPGRRASRTRRVMARGWLRLRLRRRIALLLAGAAFAVTLGLGLDAFLGAAGAGGGRSHIQPLLGALLMAVLLTGLCVLAAVWVSGPLAPAALGTVYSGLDDALDSARQVEAALRAQLGRATHQSATARHLMDEMRTLTDVATALEHGVALLRDTASQFYAGGAGTPVARSMAVATSQINGSAEQAIALCQRLRIFTNQVIAEATTLGEGGQQAASHAGALLAALQRVEAALGSVGATTSSTGLRAAGVMQGALARVAAQAEGPNNAPPPQGPAAARASVRMAAVPRRMAWQHTGRTVPRLGRSGRPMTHPHLQGGGDTLSASSFHPGSGGPRPASNHPSTSRHAYRPWYTDEPPAADTGNDQASRPESSSHPTPHPHPGDWMGQ